jgi:hypothetical protein
MGYSSPKKQLDLKDFLSKPGKPRPSRANWNRAAAPVTKKTPAAKPEVKSD